MPDIDFTGDDAGPPAPTVTSAPDTPAQPAAADPPAPPRDTALAAIMALSEEERIALFT
jgi:hypothetical protein